MAGLPCRLREVDQCSTRTFVPVVNRTRRGASCAILTRKRLRPKCSSETDVNIVASVEPGVQAVQGKHSFSSGHH